MIRHVEILLATGGLTRDQIAKLAGIGRSTVTKVAAGVVTSTDSRRLAAAGHGQFRDVVPFRCPGCGAMSRLSPCPRCYVHAIRKRLCGDGKIAVGLELRPEHNVRYQEIRRRREAIEANG